MSYTIEQLAVAAHSRHGVDCPKAEHLDQRGGYLHGSDDDRPYDVDGVLYCGRCHGWIGTTVVRYQCGGSFGDSGEGGK